MIDSSMFYMNFEITSEAQRQCVNEIKNFNWDDINPIYVLRKPIIDKKTDYEYDEAFAILVSKHKIVFVNFGNNEDAFKDFQEDFIDDIGYIAKKYDFINLLGRPRNWKEEFVSRIDYQSENFSLKNILKENELSDSEKIRKGDILISLTTGSINEATRLGLGVPENVLDQIKRKIILFDGEQTKFIFDEPKKKRIIIQGLAGTGKTELLLHKIKELYINNEDCKIVFTCHNAILADNLRKRVPEFFNFLKVEEQIQWEQRLWVMRSWGSFSDKNSGLYSYICNYYNIPFRRFSSNCSFDEICRSTLSYLKNLSDFHCCFDYILIDESQDFSEGFFKLCEMVTKESVYVAGDIFQDIFDNKSLTVVNPDFLLNKCYRTDPRTLMGAHAIGMGLFEKKLRWLKDEEWIACGYNIKREGRNIELHRKPIRRFEDIGIKESDGIIVISETEDGYANKILDIIGNIKIQNPTVSPDDIGIIFMENMEKNYKLASMLQFLIKKEYNWTVNIGYETKEKKKDTLFISNRNNVKGLEFPFVICVMQNDLTNDFSVRNSIYMMLTRSFLTSYLILPQNSRNIELLRSGIECVNKKGFLDIKEPSDEEKLKLANAIIERDNVHKSLYDIAEEILDDIGNIDSNKREKIHIMISTVFDKEIDKTKLREFIKFNCSMVE